MDVNQHDKKRAKDEYFEEKFITVDGISVKFNHCQKCGKYHINKKSVAPDKLLNIEKLMCERIKKFETDLKITQEGPETIPFVCSQGFPYSLPYNSENQRDVYGKSLDMPTNADELLQSLLGEVHTSFGGAIDVSEIVSKSTTKSRIQVSPPKLFMEDAKEKEKREKREKRDKDGHHISSKHSSLKAPTEKPWLIEPIKKMPVVDDLPMGADFQLFHPKIKEDPPKVSPSKKEKKKKKDKEKSSKKKKKKSKEDEQKERLELVPRTLSLKNLPPSELKLRNDVEDGEICDDGPNNGWMSLSADKAKNLETTDDIFKRKLAHKKKKKKDKEKQEGKNKDKEEKASSSSKKHKSKKDKKDSSKDKEKSKAIDGRKSEKEKNSEKKDHCEKDEKDRNSERERERLKSTGCLAKPLTPKRDSSDKSKILPSSWSKQLNNLLKDSNQEFSSSTSKDNESSRNKDKDRSDADNSTSNGHRKHSNERDKSQRDYQGTSSHHRNRDHEKDEHYTIPKRRDRSRSRTPAVGRGRNFFRRTDAEWREHQVERIRKRNQSPVRIYEADYMDKYGNIDKKKLMDVATRNVTKLAMCGALPKGYELLSTIKNKTVQQLVNLCQQLHDEDERARYGRSSSESEGEDDNRYGGWEHDNTFSIRDVKDPEKPKYEVIDGTPFLVKSEEEQRHEDSFLRVSYPVSSGMEHRQKELEPSEDEIQPLALSTALARIKTNIPPAFMSSMETEMFPLIEPMKPLPLPPPEPPSKAFTDFTASLSSSTGQNQDVISNMLGSTETLNRPIEISKPIDTGIKEISPVIPSKKPLLIRASFLKSGKKAAEEALRKILPGPEPVPAPDLSLLSNVTSVQLLSPNNVSKTPEPVPLPYILPLDPIVPIEAAKENPSKVMQEVTHSDALSAILDRVDQLMTQGKINEMATVEKKDLNLHKTPEKLVENYVKIPGGGIVKKEPLEPRESRMEVAEEEKNIDENEKDKNEDANSMEIEDKTNEDKEEPSEISIAEDKPKEKKKKEKSKEKKEKKEKKRKHHHREEMEEGEIKEKKPKISLKIETSHKKFGPQIPDIVKKERALPNAIANDFDYRSPLPFIKALTAPQLAIEAAPAKGSLKAEWNDPRNPLVASIKDDDSIPLPFRIIAPTVQPLVKPEDLVFKTPRCITHPPRMINDLVSRRAKYSIILQQDPNDRYARRQIEDIDRDMSAWAESKNIPGRFTGRTGARVLSVDELAPSDPRYNSWARKDLFLTAPEHESEFGKKILEKMGWQKGAGLGRKMNGSKEPLKLDIKADRRGLSTGNEKGSGKRETIQDVNGKNPVSLVMEYTSRYRLQPPTFTCIESGPSTARRFLWKVTIDGVEYEPSMPSTNKKAGKAQVCVVVLQSLGLVPPVLPG